MAWGELFNLCLLEKSLAYSVSRQRMRNSSARPIAVTVALCLIALAVLLRLAWWFLAANGTAVATYTSFFYVGPFTLFLAWGIYRCRNWGRWAWAMLYVPHLLSWTRAMVMANYSAGEIALMSFLLLLQAVAVLLLFLPASNAWFRAGNGAADEDASPNCGPGKRLGNSGVSGGPPSVGER